MRPREADTRKWAEDRHRNAIEVAGMLGIPPEVYTRDPMTVIPALDDYASRAPLNEFEESDWITLHLDLVSFLADFLTQKYDARWILEDDPEGPVGHRYVIEATGFDGQTHRIDPVDIVRMEFSSPPIEIARLLATAELNLGLASHINSDRPAAPCPAEKTETST
ncbi:hypothetical protein GCM10009549_45020 [Streptomyces thermoalcalitolerans]|uniref:Uncharacterized protein n=2 Tax=Streptomyces thermoalcalitolerans TaxID=65605 RepID=A0ABP3ZRD6_9ACTN